MSGIHIQGEPILPFDPELKRTLQRMNNPQNPSNVDDGINLHLPPPVDAHNQVVAANQVDDTLRGSLPSHVHKSSIGETLTSLILIDLFCYLLYCIVTY